MTLLLETRSPTESDLRFIHSSWHTSYWKTHMRKKMEREVYAPAMDAWLDIILDKVHIIVTYAAEVPDEILGWVAYDASKVLWLYVKGYARRQGIATGLVQNAAFKYYALETDAGGKKFAESVGLKFNPLY